ncbi:MAG: hypothetical protein HKN11_05095 [Rhizobiales bacterium]|nr:hypothetical protein [Hyphomicrobiales bacterium]
MTYLAASARLYRYAFKLVRRYSFMPACRIFSVVAYYMRFKRLLTESNIKAVFIANHYSPECLGLATAAHDGQMKVLLTNHASGTGETGYVAPVYADLAAVTSQAMADLYRKYSPKGLQIIRLPIATPQKPMTIPAVGQRSLVAGIYLTALTNETRLRELVAELLKAGNIATVFIRIHPADVVNSDLSGIVANGKPIEISQHKPLSEDIERTDLAIVGNSSVTIELLRGGCPVLYDHRLDEIIYDYNGFEGRGLVLAFPARLQKKFLDDVEAHYGSQAWIETMRYFDWGYQRDEKTMLRDFKSAVLRTVAPS